MEWISGWLILSVIVPVVTVEMLFFALLLMVHEAACVSYHLSPGYSQTLPLRLSHYCLIPLLPLWKINALVLIFPWKP